MQPSREDQEQRAQNYIRNTILVTYAATSVGTRGGFRDAPARKLDVDNKNKWGAEKIDAMVKASSFTAQIIKKDGKAGVGKIALSMVGKRLEEQTEGNLTFIRTYRPSEFYNEEVWKKALSHMAESEGKPSALQLLTAFKSVDPAGFDAMMEVDPEIHIMLAGPAPSNYVDRDNFFVSRLQWSGIITGGSASFSDAGVRFALSKAFVDLFGINKSNYAAYSEDLKRIEEDRAKSKKSLDLPPMGLTMERFLFASTQTASQSAIWTDSRGAKIGTTVQVSTPIAAKFKELVDNLLTEYYAGGKSEQIVIAEDDVKAHRIDITNILSKGGVEKTYSPASNYVPLKGFQYNGHANKAIKAIPDGFFIGKVALKGESVLGGERAVRGMRKILDSTVEERDKAVLDAYVKSSGLAMLAKLGCRAKGGAKKGEKGIDMSGKSRSTSTETTTEAAAFVAPPPASNIFGGAVAGRSGFGGAANPFTAARSGQAKPAVPRAQGGVAPFGGAKR